MTPQIVIDYIEALGHRRLYDWIDPTHPDYQCNGMAVLLTQAQQHFGTALSEEEMARARRAAKPRVPLGQRPAPGRR